MTRKLLVAAMAVVLVAGLVPIASAQEETETPMAPAPVVTPVAPAPVVMTPMAPPPQKRLQITRGTMELGGQITFTFQTAFATGGGGSISGYQFSLNPLIGYFIMDGVELMAKVGFQMWGGDVYAGGLANMKNVSFLLGPRYVYDPGWGVNPYIGVLLGMDFQILDHDGVTDTQKTFNLDFPIGILIPLNQHVAVTFGIEIIYGIILDASVNQISLPIGFGVEGFF